MLLATRSALKADGDLLTTDERTAIDHLMAQLEQVLETATQAADIEASTKALAQGTEAFAAQRMNRGIGRALAGRRIDTM
jgi:molecular chaperone HscA